MIVLCKVDTANSGTNPIYILLHHHHGDGTGSTSIFGGFGGFLSVMCCFAETHVWAPP